MTLPALIVTGSSGFVGRRLLEALKEHYTIYGLARRSQARCGAPVHPNIHWFQVDIADRHLLRTVFDEIESRGGVQTVIHLAAHYDFTGEEHPEYDRTNVEGLHNVLDMCQHIGIETFIFSSSLAACSFPSPGEALNESSLPDGDHIYARTKGIGESMLGLYRAEFKPVIVRFAAMFSDWCEYPPLFMFLQTWLSRAWNRRMLGGRGNSAIPYLHVRDGVRFLNAVLEHAGELDASEVVIASPDGATSHEELFRASTFYHEGEFQRAIHIPRPLVLPGIRMRCLAGRMLGEMPFERPWMSKYVDQVMATDASHSRQRLDWEPRERLEVLRRLPFLLENLKADPAEWHRRNRAAIKRAHLRPNLKIHALLGKHEAEIIERFTHSLTSPQERERFPSYQAVEGSEHAWNHRLILQQLMHTIRTRERAVFLSYCRALAERRFNQGFSSEEVCGALTQLERICLDLLSQDPDAADVQADLHQHLYMTVRFACDEVQETFEMLEEEAPRAAP